MKNRPDVTFVQLRYFVEAATYSSMTRASQHLMVAQSAVSSAVAQLEHQIGTQLFIRHRSKGLVLTAAGEEMLRDTRILLAHLGEVLDAARGHEDTVRGTVRLACFVTLAPFLLPTLVSRLRTIHPELEIEVIETEAEQVRGTLRNGAAEIALTYDLGLGDDLHVELLGRAAPHIIVARDHRLADRTSVRLAELEGEPMVLLDLPSSRDYFLALFDTFGSAPTTRYRSASYETVRGLVARGQGYSILNQIPSTDSTYDGGHVAVLSIEDEVPSLPIVLARLRDVRTTARVTAVYQQARAIFALQSGTSSAKQM